jgi:hypothetical protein
MLGRIGLMAVAVLVAAGSARGQWTAVGEATLTASDTAPFDEFGCAVAAGGDTAVIGAQRADHGKGPLEEVRGLAFDPMAGALYGGEDQNRVLVTIDPVTGSSSSMIGWPADGGMAFDPNTGLLYGVGYRLVRYDPAAAAFSYSSKSLGFNAVRALAFDPGANVLYGLDVSTDQLITIKKASGKGTAVGPVGFMEVEGLAFDTNTNTLYGSDVLTDQLLVIDPATGLGTAVGPLGFDLVEGLAFDSVSGTLYGSDKATDQLLVIDTSTGSATAVTPLTGSFLDAGAAYVFSRSGTVWNEQAKLTDPGPSHHAGAGGSVAVSADTILIGVPGLFANGSEPGIPGSVPVFVRSGTQWIQQATLVASDGVGGDRFGASVWIGGDTAFVGAPTSYSWGVAYVFERSGSAWTETQKLTPKPNATRFGAAVAVHGDWALIGAPAGGPYPGYAFFFEQVGGSWVQRTRFTSPFPPPHSWRSTGASVALSENRALIGDPLDDLGVLTNHPPFGSVWALRRNGNAWDLHAKIKEYPKCSHARFGSAVSLSGDRALIGRTGGGVCGDGSVRLFVPETTTWRRKHKFTASGSTGSGDGFGSSVANSGDTVVSGAPFFPGPAGETGAAFVHRLINPLPTSYCTAGTSASGCRATISASGTPSSTATSGFVLSAQKVEGARKGLFLLGMGGKQGVPWGNGTSFLCIGPPVAFGGPMPAAGTPGACDSSFALDLNGLWCSTCPKPNLNREEGSVLQAQLWYRDPFNTSNQTTSLSDAIEFSVAP